MELGLVVRRFVDRCTGQLVFVGKLLSDDHLRDGEAKTQKLLRQQGQHRKQGDNLGCAVDKRFLCKLIVIQGREIGTDKEDQSDRTTQKGARGDLIGSIDGAVAYVDASFAIDARGCRLSTQP